MAGRRRIGDEEFLDAAGAERLAYGLRTLYEEPPRLRSGGAAVQPSRSADSGRARPVESGVRGQLAAAAGPVGLASLATSTSAANVPGSETASSASIRRSTSTPASRSPWTNRL